MVPPPAVWPFAAPPVPARRADVVLAVFGRTPLDLAALEPAAVGIPAGVALPEVRTVLRATEPRWLDAWRTGSLRAIAERDLGPEGPDLAALDAADRVHMITASVTAPVDLGYLQAAWGLARHALAQGATTVLDVHAMTYRATAALAAPDAPLDVAREVRRIYETSTTGPDLPHALHTRGLRKFGAPDLIALCGDADVRLVGHALGALADRVARGVSLSLARHPVDVAPGIIWYVLPDEHGLGELLQLGNTARVLVDERGHDLVGVLGRLPRGSA